MIKSYVYLGCWEFGIVQFFSKPGGIVSVMREGKNCVIKMRVQQKHQIQFHLDRNLRNKMNMNIRKCKGIFLTSLHETKNMKDKKNKAITSWKELNKSICFREKKKKIKIESEIKKQRKRIRIKVYRVDWYSKTEDKEFSGIWMNQNQSTVWLSYLV